MIRLFIQSFIFILVKSLLRWIWTPTFQTRQTSQELLPNLFVRYQLLPTEHENESHSIVSKTKVRFLLVCS